MSSAAARLPTRPVVTTPERLRPPAVVAAERRRIRRQPWLGLAGLLLVLPVAALLAFGVAGPESSVVVLGPLVTFSLPVVAVVAFWWEDWPGTMVGPDWWSGWFNTLVIVVLAFGLALLGQAVVSTVDLRSLVDANPPAGHSPGFPALLPLAGLAFVAMLQLTLVNEGWPLRRLPRIPAGLAALAAAWAVAVLVFFLVVRAGVLDGARIGALGTVIGVWQVWFFLAWRGWPFSLIRTRWMRLVAGNVVTLLGGWLTWLALRDVAPGEITAGAGCLIAAGLVVTMLFEGTLRPYLSPVGDRVASLVTIAALAAGLYAGFTAYAETVDWVKLEPPAWVAHAALNALGVAVILHVAVGRRWPFRGYFDASAASST